MAKRKFKELEIKGSEFIEPSQLNEDIEYARSIIKDIKARRFSDCYENPREMIDDLRGIIENIAENVLGNEEYYE